MFVSVYVCVYSCMCVCMCVCVQICVLCVSVHVCVGVSLFSKAVGWDCECLDIHPIHCNSG